MENVIVNAKIAVENAQKFNRNNWLKDAGKKLSAKILAVAETGRREITFDFNDLIVGAENLYEAGEMLAYLNEKLTKSGYTNVVEPNGTLHITW